MNKFKEIRLKLGLTQVQMSQVLHIPLKSIQNWEYGRTNPPPYLLPMIEIIFENDLLSEMEGVYEDEIV